MYRGSDSFLVLQGNPTHNSRPFNAFHCKHLMSVLDFHGTDLLRCTQIQHYFDHGKCSSYVFSLTVLFQFDSVVTIS